MCVGGGSNGGVGSHSFLFLKLFICSYLGFFPFFMGPLYPVVFSWRCPGADVCRWACVFFVGGFVDDASVLLEGHCQIL